MMHFPLIFFNSPSTIFLKTYIAWIKFDLVLMNEREREYQIVDISTTNKAVYVKLCHIIYSKV